MHDSHQKICMISGNICMISGKICMVSGKICMISEKYAWDPEKYAWFLERYADIYVYLYMYICIYTYIYLCMYIYTYTHMYITRQTPPAASSLHNKKNVFPTFKWLQFCRCLFVYFSMRHHCCNIRLVNLVRACRDLNPGETRR